MKKSIFLVISLMLPGLVQATDVTVTALRVEQMTNPMGVGTATPHLGWHLESDAQNVMQTAYQILVASSPELLSQNHGDLWDSGKVESGESQWIVYAGKALQSNVRAYWKVKSFTNVGESEWSEPAFWGTGILKETQWKGLWIGVDRSFPWDSETIFSKLSSRYLRKEFSIEKPVKQATVHIAGLGLYELFINGNHIGDQVLAPSPTDYRKTIVYNSFDVTDLLAGENAIGVTLGNGHFYTMRQDIFNVENGDDWLASIEWVNFGYPKLRLNLIVEYTDGTTDVVASDYSWKLTTDGPIRSNNQYDGEEYDARKELGAWTKVNYDDSSWQRAERVYTPTGTLRGAMAPNMKVVKTVAPVSIQPLGDKYILDMGQNFTGWLRMKVKGEESDVIRLRFAETLQPDGEIYTDNLRYAKATDTYVCNGKENGGDWAPCFVFHGFRYVEITGYENPQLSDFIGEVVSDEMDVIGEFSCSNETLNKIYKNAYWGIMSDYKGFPVDCPQRDEREPWLGDRDAGCWGESYIFDNAPLYTKWVRDICEAQREDGCIPDVAPAFWTCYSDNVTWPYALPSACDMLYTRFGNKQAVEECYPHIKLWLKHLCEEYMTEGYILTKDTYGDWCVPPESPEMILSKDPARVTDGSLMSTAYIVKVLQLLQRFAQIQGLDEDVQEYKTFEKLVTDGFNAKFLNVGDAVYYGNNTVTANILPLAFGMVPKEYEAQVVKSLVKTITETNDTHVSCGVIGMQWLLTELSRRGFADIAWTLATNTTYPSWGYMVDRGATTIWELWNGDTADPSMNSGNHVMLIGDLISWCYENVGGIRPDYSVGKTGFKHIILQPEFGIQGLDYANVSYQSVYGKIESNWKRIKKFIEWEVTVPANTTAEVHLPDGNVEQVGSGHYTYKVKNY